MSRFAGQQAPAGYTLLVDGHLDDHWSPWFDDLTLTHNSDGTTSLSGSLSDQAQLHGLLVKIRDLGLTLIALDIIEPTDSIEPAPTSMPTGAGRRQPNVAPPDVADEPARHSQQAPRGAEHQPRHHC
jgi:hypothetical protein